MARPVYGRLMVSIEKATDLPNFDWFSNASDPYCIVYFDDEEIGRTETFTDESSPVWNEDFFVTLNGEGENIIFIIYDKDSFKMDDLIATVVIPIESLCNKNRTEEVQERHTVADLQTASGECAGKLHYTLKWREFGGPFTQATVDGNRKGLYIGINYVNKEKGKNTGRLNGCHTNVAMLSELAETHYGYKHENSKFLLDDGKEDSIMPTRRNMERAMEWLVKDAKKGDSLLFQFAGHGGQRKDRNGDEEDGMDETICPYDSEKAGQISDDDLFRMLVRPLPEGVFLTAVMDCCHSGTILDLPFIHRMDEDEADFFEEKHASSVPSDLKEPDFVTAPQREDEDEENNEELDLEAKLAKLGIKARNKHGKGKGKVTKSNKKYDNSSSANVVMISGCLDSQTGIDTGTRGGVMTLAFMNALKEADGPLSYRQLLINMRQIVRDGGWDQIPQLSTSRPFDIDQTFVI